MKVKKDRCVGAREVEGGAGGAGSVYECRHRQ